MNCRRETGDAEELDCSCINPFEFLVCGLINESMVRRCEANLALRLPVVQGRKRPATSDGPTWVVAALSNLFRRRWSNTFAYPPRKGLLTGE